MEKYLRSKNNFYIELTPNKLINKLRITLHFEI